MRNNLLNLGLFVGVFILYSSLSAQDSEKNGGVQWSPLLKLASRKAIHPRLARPFGDVFVGTVLGKPATVSNCNEYLALSNQDFKTPDTRAAAVLHNDAVECVALKMLQSARAPHAALSPPFKLTAESLNDLPPELAPAVSNDLIEQAKAADAAGKSWKTYLPEAVAKPFGQDQLDVTQSGWSTRLTLYASADFTGHGNRELLVRADYHAEQGTYSNSQLFILAPGNSGKDRLRLVREVPVP